MSDDVADRVEGKRIDEIMTLKREVYDIKDEIDTAQLGSNIAPGAIELYQRKVRDYIVSMEPLLKPSDGEPSPYWDRVFIGDFKLPDGGEKTVTGLREFLQLPTSFPVESVEETQESYRHMPQRETVTKQVRPPRRLIENAFRTGNEAFHDLGFGISSPEGMETKQFRKIDDVKKATEILDFLQQLDDDGLREVKTVIDNDLLGGASHTNGHHE
jgi:hypothetical protein